jgi:hypothetical protein
MEGKPMTGAKAITGGCQCGAVRYAASTSPSFSIICCCTQCQKITGSGHAPQFALAKADVTLTGTPTRYILAADSGNEVTSAFCATCGSPLYKTSVGHPEFMFFHAATLDDPSLYRPQSVVWVRSRQPWDYVDPALPAQS